MAITRTTTTTTTTTVAMLADSGIDRVARAMAGRRTRRSAIALLAAGIAAAARPGAAPAAEECGCKDGEICIGGICSVVVEDSCEALGCAKGFRCEQGVCVKAPRRKKARSGG